MKYRKYGTSKHLIIENSKDLFELLTLDNSLWCAMSAPASVFNTDKTFLNYLDKNKNSRITTEEITSAVKWMTEVLVNYKGIDQKLDFLELSWLNKNSEDSEKIINSINNILMLDTNKTKIYLDTVQTKKNEIEAMPVSESGVVLAKAAGENKDLSTYIQLAIDVTGGEDHPSKEKGITDKTLDSFCTILNAYIEWKKIFTDAINNKNLILLPLLDKTYDFYLLYENLAVKIDEFFIQSKAYFYSKDTYINICSFNEEDLKKIDLDKNSKLIDVLKKSPLVKPKENLTIELDKDILNPVFADNLKKFMILSEGLIPLKKCNTLNEELWTELKAILAPYCKWRADIPCNNFEEYELYTLIKFSESEFREQMLTLIAKSEETAELITNIRLVERLLLYQKNIINFTNNFASFPDLYNPHKKALFEKGTFYVDGRQLELSVLVEDKAKHLERSKSSYLFLVYVDVFPAEITKYTVVLPVTKGNKGNLVIGKRGIFKDCDSKIHDAVIVDILENPISLRETLTYPFKKIGNIFITKFDTLSKDSDKTFTNIASNTIDGNKIPKDIELLKNKTSSFSPATFIMGGSVAIAALGSGITYIASEIASVSNIKIIITILVIILILLTPPVINTYLKLRKRDISSVLEGSGWAINSKLTLTRKLCKIFTKHPSWPKSAKRVIFKKNT